ncbi:MAG: acyl-CoA dehydrogenase [Gemmatimonadetes bacterium]|nr:acyl-CoA dehydrogenase [Gemmatimonadota bacterium]
MSTSERVEIQAMAREFAAAELRPYAAEWDERRDLDATVFGKLAELGFLGMLIPEKHGGLGFDFATYVAVLEELAWGDASVALAVAVHNGPVATLIVRHASAEQQRRWLPKLASGEALGAFAMSEPRSGSDPGGLATRARRAGPDWSISGEKRWITNGGRAGLVVLLAATGDEHAVGAFVVSPTAAGYTVGKREQTLGLRASETVALELHDVAVSADDLIGDEREGLHYAMEALDVGRVGTAAQAVGIGRAAMEHAATYALERRQFGQPIARFGAIQEKLARMAERLAAGRALTLDAAVALGPVTNGAAGSTAPDRDRGRLGLEGRTARAAVAMLAASDAATNAADEAVQVFGGYGYMRHYPVERLLRDAKGTEIYGGTSEIMRHVIARELLRDVGELRGDKEA